MKNPIRTTLSAVFATLVLLLAACSQTAPTLGTKAPAVLGLLKVTVSGVGEGASASATAEWVTGASSKPAEVKGQAATVVPVLGTNMLGDVQLTRRLVSFDDDDLNSTRYVRATFDIVNRSTINFNNLTLFAVNAPDNLGGTAIAAVASGSGVPFASPADTARAFKPTHAMRPANHLFKVNEDNADLQFFTPAEALDMQNQAQSTPDPFTPGSNILPFGSTVLEYGFVARNLSGGRAIAAPDTQEPAECTTNACKGTVTLAYRFPRVSPRANNPFSFSLYFIVANETTAIASQSLEEQAANTVMGLNSLTAFSRLRTLVGSSFDLSSDALDPMCRVKTAIGPDLFLGASLTPPAPGSLDVCFGVGGKRTTAFSGVGGGRSVAIQSDGKIVLAGYSGQSTAAEDFSVVRYNPNGSLDTSFGSGGKVTTAIGSASDQAHSVVIQSDGKIVVAGSSFNGVHHDFAVVRYNPNGSLDTSFDTDGKATTDLNGINDIAYSVAIQSDGKIVAAGETQFNFSVVRYNTNGSLDTSFDGDGKVTTAATGRAISGAIQGDGKIVLAGTSSSGGDFVLVRYTPGGLLDSSFGTAGKVQTDMGATNDLARGMVLQSDGKIVVAGTATITQFALARYNSDGTLDTSFDGDGKVFTDVGPAADFGNAVALQSDGKIVMGGGSRDSGGRYDFSLVRYNSDGSLDTSFDGDGKAITPFGSADDLAYSLAIQSDGKLVVGGYSVFGSGQQASNHFALVRYNP